jgi:hypothetical protein
MRRSDWKSRKRDHQEMHKFWRTHGLDEVNKGESDPPMKKCLQDVIITELDDLNEVTMKEQITIRMTKTMHQDPPHYSTQDSKLIRNTIAGLIDFVSDDLATK